MTAGHLLVSVVPVFDYQSCQVAWEGEAACPAVAALAIMEDDGGDSSEFRYVRYCQRCLARRLSQEPEFMAALLVWAVRQLKFPATVPERVGGREANLDVRSGATTPATPLQSGHRTAPYDFGKGDAV